jgi:Family of unknown function (DUF5985)
MISAFVSGCIFFGFMVVAGHFLRFWKTTHDKFFLLFAIAFILMGIERICVALYIGAETLSYIYITRLIAACFIIAGIIYKNRK